MRRKRDEKSRLDKELQTEEREKVKNGNQKRNKKRGARQKKKRKRIAKQRNGPPIKRKNSKVNSSQ